MPLPSRKRVLEPYAGYQCPHWSACQALYCEAYAKNPVLSQALYVTIAWWSSCLSGLVPRASPNCCHSLTKAQRISQGWKYDQNDAPTVTRKPQYYSDRQLRMKSQGALWSILNRLGGGKSNRRTQAPATQQAGGGDSQLLPEPVLIRNIKAAVR